VLYVRAPGLGSLITLGVPTAMIMRKLKRPWLKCLRKVIDVRSQLMGKPGSRWFFLVVKRALMTAQTALTDAKTVVSMMELRLYGRLAGYGCCTFLGNS
jgi:hypothetical protein